MGRGCENLKGCNRFPGNFIIHECIPIPVRYTSKISVCAHVALLVNHLVAFQLSSNHYTVVVCTVVSTSRWFTHPV